MKTRFLILLILLVTFSFNAGCQSATGTQAKIKVRVNKKYTRYWDKVIVQNKDTTVYHWISQYYRRTLIDSIPPGKYTVTLNSVFNDNIEKVIIHQTKTTVRFDVENFYRLYTDTVSLLDIMTKNDTLRIHYDEWGCFGGPSGYCIIIRDTSAYRLVVKTGSNEIWSFPLTQTEESTVRNLEYKLRKQGPFRCMMTTGTRYQWELNTCILDYKVCGPSYINELIVTRSRTK